MGNGKQKNLIKQRPETQNYIKAEQSTWIECMLSYLTESFEFPKYHGNRQCQYRKDKSNRYQSELHFLQSFLWKIPVIMTMKFLVRSEEIVYIINIVY